MAQQTPGTSSGLSKSLATQEHRVARQEQVKTKLRPLAAVGFHFLVGFLTGFSAIYLLPLSYHDPQASEHVLTPAVLSNGHHKLQGNQPQVSAQPHSLLNTLEQAT